MKFLVVLAVAVACVAADVSHIVKPVDVAATIVRSAFESSPSGQAFQYGYETSNGIQSQAEGVLKDPSSEYPTLEVKGSYSYVDPNGVRVDTTYVSNENGFQPAGSHIPVAPPIPELILRALAYTEAHKPAVERVYKP